MSRLMTLSSATERRRRVAASTGEYGLDYVEVVAPASETRAEHELSTLRLYFIPPAENVAKIAVPEGLNVSSINVLRRPEGTPASWRVQSLVAAPQVAALAVDIMAPFDAPAPPSTELRAALAAAGLGLAPGEGCTVRPIVKGRTWTARSSPDFHGGALRFAGDGGRVSASLKGVPAALTIQFWVKRNATGAGGVFSLSLSHGGDGPPVSAYKIAFDDAGILEFSVFQAAQEKAVAIRAEAPVDEGCWVNFACVFAPGQRFEIWRDAVLDNRASAAGLGGPQIAAGDAAQLSLGASLGSRGAFDGFNGDIDEVRLWRDAPDAIALWKWLNIRLNGAEPGLWLYWSLDEGQGAQCTNRLPEGNAVGVLTPASSGENPLWTPSQAPLTPFDLVFEMIDTGVGTGAVALTPLQNFIDLSLKKNTDAGADGDTFEIVLGEGGGLDPFFRRAPFNLDVDIPSDGDPRVDDRRPAVGDNGPPVSYTARDFEGLNAQIQERLAITQPDWVGDEAADIKTVFTDVLAYLGDRLSYYQDAAATEAYLGTARRRISVQRHSRLLDYPFSNGANARAWVALEITAGDGETVSGPGPDKGGTVFIAGADRSENGGCVARRPLSDGIHFFETMENLIVDSALNRFDLYTWDGEISLLTKGAVSAAVIFERPLGVQALKIFAPGRVMMLEQERSAQTGLSEDADPQKRQAVRLTTVSGAIDPLFPDQTKGRLFQVSWGSADQLDFDLPIGSLVDPQTGDDVPLARVSANVALVDQGRTVLNETIGQAAAGRPFHPRLGGKPVTQQGHVLDGAGVLRTFDPDGPAVAAVGPAANVIAAAVLRDSFNPSMTWSARRDLLQSGRFARDFVVEVENDETAVLRFGDNQFARRPESGAVFKARYRVGNGTVGNVGAGAIDTLEAGLEGIAFRDVRNPLPASGGADPETMAHAVSAAPQAFKTEARAVTPEDYRTVVETFADVQAALGTLLWIGAWPAIVITVQRKDAQPVDASFMSALSRYLGVYRMAGSSIVLRPPAMVPILVELVVEAQENFLPGNVASYVTEALGSGVDRDGRPGYFNTVNWSFAESVYANRILGQAMRVPGVRSVKLLRFMRIGGRDLAAESNAVIAIGNAEIAQAANDPSAPERGKVVVSVLGGVGKNDG